MNPKNSIAPIADENSLPVHLNLNVRGLEPSATLAINERSNRLRREGRTIHKLGLGQSPFPVPTPLVDALRDNAFQKDYLAVRGLRELRDAVAAYRRRRHGIDCSGDDVLIGPGSKELMFLLQLVYYGDLVIPTPTWVSYAPQAHIIGRHVRWLDTKEPDGWRLTADAMDRLCSEDPGRPRIVILNYPSNPTGGTYHPRELEELAIVARRHHCILLSDEIYGELHHEGRHISIARFYPEGTISSSGLSKWCGAGGWRLGTFIFPRGLRWLLDAMSIVASETFTSTCAPIQYAAVRAFQGGSEIESYLAHSRRILRALGMRLAGRLRAAGIEVAPPQGGFYLFPSFHPHREALEARGLTDSVGLCEHLLEDTGVAILPGSHFGRPREELTARLAYVDFDGAEALAASQSMPLEEPLGDSFVETHCRGVLQAADKICAWIKG